MKEKASELRGSRLWQADIGGWQIKSSMIKPPEQNCRRLLIGGGVTEPNTNLIYGASPELEEKFNHLPCEVHSKFQWNNDHNRYELVVVIRDKTNSENISNSWQYIKVMREMLQRFQGPWPDGGYYFWPERACRMSKKGGSESSPGCIAQFFNRWIDKRVAELKESGLEPEHPPEHFTHFKLSSLQTLSIITIDTGLWYRHH